MGYLFDIQDFAYLIAGGVLDLPVDCISCSIFSSDSLHHLDSPEPVDMLIVDGALCNAHGGSHAFAICIICMAILTMSRWIF
jgi:hypothetical protein